MDHFCYIAAQAPSEETSVLFWEMVWQQNVRVVVMLTNLVEGLGFQSTKCSLYWPELVGNTRRFGQDIEVQLYDCQEAPDYLVKYRNEQFFERQIIVVFYIIIIRSENWTYPSKTLPELLCTFNALLGRIDLHPRMRLHCYSWLKWSGCWPHNTINRVNIKWLDRGLFIVVLVLDAQGLS